MTPRASNFVLLLAATIAGCSSPQASPTVSRVPDRVTPAPIDPADLVVSVEPWSFEGRDGQLIRTPSYRVYTTASRYGLPNRIPIFLERCLIHYTTALGDLPPPREAMETYLLANRPQWTRVTQRFMGSDAEVYLKIQRGGFSANGRAILYDIGPRDTFAITAHEGWHQYTQRTFKAPLTVCFEEGLATYMEGFRWEDGERTRPRFLPWANMERYTQLRSAFERGRLTTLATLQQSTPQQIIGENPDAALVYYAQVWALIHFLNEGQEGRHKDALEELLQDAASGELSRRIRREAGGRAAMAYTARRTGVDLLHIYFGIRAQDMEGPYREFIERTVRVGSREKVVMGQSPIP